MLFYLFPIIIGFAHAQEVLNFEDLPNLIQNKNKRAQASALDLNASQMRLGYFRRSFLPRFEATAGYESFETGPYPSQSDPFYFVRGSINLYRGGRDVLEDKARFAEKEVMNVTNQQTYQGELLQVRQLYWSLVYLVELKKLYEMTLDQNKKNLAHANRLIKSGLSTQVDRLEFEISGTLLDQDIARISVDISNHHRQIAALIGSAPETIFQTLDRIPHDHESPTATEELDFGTYRDVRREQAFQLNLETTAQLLKRWWVPNLDVYAESGLFTFRERNFFTQSDRMDSAVGVKFTLEFDGFQQKVDGEAFAARARASSLRAQQIKAETAAVFNTAKQELFLIHDLLHVGEKNVEKSQEYLNAVLSDYNRGVKNSPDVLSASLKNLEFRKRFAELRRDYAVVNAKLEAMLAHDH
jgi:outer membrane protein TolC